MTVKEIIVAHLQSIGADGLYCPVCGEDECGCGIEDLVPCYRAASMALYRFGLDPLPCCRDCAREWDRQGFIVGPLEQLARGIVGK